jgi:predicted  nucleic acid-binding Zn-ribbon protein
MKTKLAVIGVGILALAAGTAGQSVTTSDPLLAEVKALRAELNQAAGTSIRTQLLVARLQLQEQRINTIAKQLNDVQAQRTSNDFGVAQMTARIKQLEESSREGSMPADARKGLEQEAQSLKAPMNQMRQRSQELSTQESALSGQLASEQSRWMDFNGRLDEIERDIRDRK